MDFIVNAFTYVLIPFIFPLGISFLGTVLTYKFIDKRELKKIVPRLQRLVLDTQEKCRTNHATLVKCNEFIEVMKQEREDGRPLRIFRKRNYEELERCVGARIMLVS